MFTCAQCDDVIEFNLVEQLDYCFGEAPQIKCRSIHLQISIAIQLYFIETSLLPVSKILGE